MTIQAPDTFYTIRGTMPSTSPSYVRRKADDQLCEALARGEFCFLLTSRQVGKSSLMTRSAVAMRAQKNGTAVVVLDVTSQGENVTPQQWYGGLLDQIGEQLRLEDELEDYWREHVNLGVMPRWISAITRVALPALGNRPLVIFVDEVDFTRTLPFPTDEFFAGIRECYNRRTLEPELSRLTFCLIGSARPIDLMRDIRTTPFNIGQRIDLTDFTLEEALPLTGGLHADPARARALLERVLYWTGGHPYLTQQLCCAVAAERTVSGPRGVDAICERLFFSPRGRDNDDNLVFVRDRILKSDEDPAGVLDLYRGVLGGKRVRSEDNNPLIGVLRLAGVLRLVEGHLIVRNRIYARVFNRKWVDANMPDQEKRRQRAAYRRGLIRLGIPAAIILTLVSGLAGFAMRKAGEAKDALGVANFALKQEQVAKKRADEAKERVSKVLDSLYESNGQFLRATELTGMSSATRELVVRAALHQLEDLQEQVRTDDPSLKLKFAGAYETIGRVQLKLLDLEIGAPDEARESYARALKIRQDLASSSEPTDSERMGLAFAWQFLGHVNSHAYRANETVAQTSARLREAGNDYRQAEAIRSEELKRHPGDAKHAVPVARSFFALGDFVEKHGKEYLPGNANSPEQYFRSAIACLEGIKSTSLQYESNDNTDDRPATMVEVTRAYACERLGLLLTRDAATAQQGREFLSQAAEESAGRADEYRLDPKWKSYRDGVNTSLDAANKELTLATFDFENKAGERDKARSELERAAYYLGASLATSPSEETASDGSLTEVVPVNIDVRKCLADVFELAARIDTAEIDRAHGRIGCDAALAMYLRATQERLVVNQLNPESHSALDALGRAYVQQGCATYRAKGAREALATFDRVKDVYKSDPTGRDARDRVVAEALLGSGMAKHDMGMFTEAHARLKEALGLFATLDAPGKNPAIQRNKACALAAIAANWADQNENTTAEQKFSEAIAIQKRLVDTDPGLGRELELAASMARRAAALGAAGRAEESSLASQSAAEKLKTLKQTLLGPDPRVKDATLLEALIDAYVDLAKAWKSTGKWESAWSALGELDQNQPLIRLPQRDMKSTVGVTSDTEAMVLRAEISYQLCLAALGSPGATVAGKSAGELQALVDQQNNYKNFDWVTRTRDADNFHVMGQYMSLIRYAGLVNGDSRMLNKPLKADSLLADALKFREFMANRYGKDVDVARDILLSFTDLEIFYLKESKLADGQRLRAETLGELSGLVDKYSQDSAAKLSAQLALAQLYSQSGDQLKVQEVLKAAAKCAAAIKTDYPDALTRWQELQTCLSKAK